MPGPGVIRAGEYCLRNVRAAMKQAAKLRIWLLD